MEFVNLPNTHFSNSRNQKLYNNYQRLIELLKEKELKIESIQFVNDLTECLISSRDGENKLARQIRTNQQKIYKHLEKEYKIVPKNYYRNQWMLLGMTIFGVPFGMMFGFAIDNFGLFGIGLPIGMSIGMAIGFQKDNDAKNKNLQLDIE